MLFILPISVLTSLFVLINFISYLSSGDLVTRRSIWTIVQVFTAVISPITFLITMDLSYANECCGETATFSPEHRDSIYPLIIACIAAIVIAMFRERVLPPIAELFLNLFLVLGLILNIILCKHLGSAEDGGFWVLFGNIPIIMLILITLSENHKLLRNYIEENGYHSNSLIGRFCISILKLTPLLKYPLLIILLVPVIIFFSLFLLLFGQKPDSLVRVFTDTYKHGFSQLDDLCDNVQCGGHFLCSVGANGHKKVVRPVRYGERNGNRIICTRQLLISNAFEELVQERLPGLHKLIRRNYNKVGNIIHRHYHLFNNKLVSDLVYLLMKPLEIIFVVTLYAFDRKPENRIAMQYLRKQDKESINALKKNINI